MATISNTPRPGYVWDATDNCWYPIGTGTHSHADIPNTIVTAKGDIVTATASATPAKVGVGTDKFVLGADSTAGTGLAWQSSPQSLMTTTGDSIYASAANTPARLGIGTTGQVLTVASGLPSWATPSTPGLKLIQKTTISAAGTTNVDSVFTTTYRNYKVIVAGTTSVADYMNFRLRTSGTSNRCCTSN
jgi:hypothetical protein